IPEELAEQVEAKTDSHGRATLTALSQEEIRTLRVVAGPYGIQNFSGGPERKLAELALRPVVRVAGRLMAEEKTVAAGVTVQIVTYDPMPDARGLFVSGSARVTSDADGRFAVPALAPGKLSFQFEMDKRLPYRAVAPTNQTIQAGQEAEIEIPMVPAVRVHGSVRERGTDKPVAAVGINIVSNNNTNEILYTNETGTFEGYVTPGSLVTYVHGVPKPYFEPGRRMPRPVDVEAGTDYAVPRIELVRGASLRGRVLDADGNPVAGASVSGAWTMDEGQPKSIFAMSGSSGDFLLEGVEPRAELRLSASFKDASTEADTAARASEAQPVILRISTASNMALSGRVLDRAGKPVAGAQIEIWSQTRAPQGHISGHTAVLFDGERAVRTDNTGRFLTQWRIKRIGEYRAIVHADGFVPGRTEWITVKDGKPESFPDVVLGRLRTTAGRVVDREGKPVGAATVFQSGDGPKRTTTTTDDQGRFSLSGVIDARAFVFVEKAGYRFHAQPIEPSDDEVELVLQPAADAVSMPLRTLAAPLPRDEAIRLAKRLLEPYAEQAIEQGDDSTQHFAFESLVRVDPTRVLQLLEKPSGDPDRTDFLKKDIAVELFADNADEALAVVESIQQPYAKMYAFTELSDRLTDRERGRKLDLLNQALLNARSILEPEFRLIGLGRVGERLLDLGEKEQATRILREGATLAKAMPQAAYAGFARGAFAEELAQIDLDTALDLTKDLSDKFEYDRHHGNIAHELAGKDAAAAERVLNMMRQAYQRDQWSVRVCYRMAGVDLARARGIAAKITDRYNRAYASGVMALALAGSDNEQAIELLREAFTALEQLVTSGQERFNGSYSAAVVGGALLPVAERMDPRLVPEFLWRAASFRLPRPQENESEGSIEQADALLALTLARYDRSLARTIFEPTAAKLVSLASSETYVGRGPGVLFAAAAAIDPHWAIELVEGLADAPDLSFRRPKNSARLTVAKVLALRDDSRWTALGRYLNLWTVDTEDF
ncbi:MAG: carboxypeptidase regulatory-like domain-containing protein, partial [Planctomycetes bacterium]|nr:carboxypeptidase regulatory-like domain-containing protein [Planctomycetota bacterium]